MRYHSNLFLDYANHNDFGTYEIRVGDKVRISNGLVWLMCRASLTATGRGGSGSVVTTELTFNVDNADRFRDDKLDVLQHYMYNMAPMMDPSQWFDVAGGPGSTGKPDPAMMQFLRLRSLGGKDAFLLESIFRRDVWGFMSEPVSEDNERGAVNAVIEACDRALLDMTKGKGKSDLTEMDRLCSMVRESE